MKKLLLAILAVLLVSSLLPASAYSVIRGGSLRIFLTKDPSGFVDGPNLYTYVKQNPWTNFDPEGLETQSQLQDEQKALDEGYAQSKNAINNDKNATDKERAAGLKSLDEVYAKHKADIQKRIGKLEQTARDVAEFKGGKAEDYAELDDSDPRVQELMADLDFLDSQGLKDSFLHGAHGDLSAAGENLAMGMVVGRILGPLKKAVNLPGVKKIVVDMDHILSGHTSDGMRALQSGQKDLFPGSMSPEQIEKAVKEAYSTAQKIGTKGDRIVLQGTSKDGLKIEMYLNPETKTIETAYPKGSQ
jgi:hypothetical protein